MGLGISELFGFGFGYFYSEEPYGPGPGRVKMTRAQGTVARTSRVKI